MTEPSQHVTTDTLAVAHLKCEDCGAEAGQKCVIMSGGTSGEFLRNELGIRFPRAIAHQSRRDPFIEAWTAGYTYHQEEQIQAHG